MKWLKVFQALAPLLLILSFLSINGLAADDKNDKKELAAAIGANKVMTVDGQTYQLGDAWRDRPVVLVFIRHFG